ncbi:MAG TPA: GNAT family N-acetyltransferase [Thermoplasmata archaeon]|nr:GNAT family N-acetyltransferase [Thermoplasmata archaeon]
MSDPAGAPGSAVEFAALSLSESGDALTGIDLSDWFNPFVVPFAREAIGSGGQAVIARESGRVVGLQLTDPTERVASVFSRSGAVAEAFLREPGAEGGAYAEVDLVGPRELFAVHTLRLAELPPHRFRHRVRLLGPGELAAVDALLSEVYGSSSERWLAVAASEGERCFGVDVGGTLAGVAWALVAGPWARLHTLTVRPGFRRMGVATDLLFARLLFARHAGAREALSEIAERNLPSRAVAARAGMRPAGQLFLYLGPAAVRPEALEPAGPAARPTSG